MKNRNLVIILFLLFASQLSTKIGADDIPTGICQTVDPSQASYFPYPGDCTKYIVCFDWNEIVFNCTDNLWWHQEAIACDYPGDYCDNTVTQPPPTTTTSTTTTTTPNITTTIPTTTSSTATKPPTVPPNNGDPRCVDSSTQYWPHPAYCHRYIECFLGDSYEMNCPRNLFFSDSWKECVDAELSECCVDKPCQNI